jgi:hypothetical protein
MIGASVSGDHALARNWLDGGGSDDAKPTTSFMHGGSVLPVATDTNGPVA